MRATSSSQTRAWASLGARQSPRGDSALLAKPPPKKSLPGPRPAPPPQPANGQQRPLLERLTSDAGRMQRLPSDPVPGADPRRVADKK